jgi:hypothetical protein
VKEVVWTLGMELDVQAIYERLAVTDTDDEDGGHAQGDAAPCL